MSVGPAVTYQVQNAVWLDAQGPAQTSSDPHHPLTTCPCIWVRAGSLVMIVPGNNVLAARYGGWGNLAPLNMLFANDASSKAALAN